MSLILVLAAAAVLLGLVVVCLVILFSKSDK